MSIASALRGLFGLPEQNLRVLFLGLDASGRTTTLYLLKLGEEISTIPTIGEEPGPCMVRKEDEGAGQLGKQSLDPAHNQQIPHAPAGFNVETFKVAGSEITAWDVGGCDKIRPLWRHYFDNSDAVVFFFDAGDQERIPEVRPLSLQGESLLLFCFWDPFSLPRAST
jgi:ADP-ribosylation factor protein 1